VTTSGGDRPVDRMRTLLTDEAVRRRIENARRDLRNRNYNVLRDLRIPHPQRRPELWAVHLPFAFLDELDRLGADAGTVHELLVSPLTEPDVPTGRGTALEPGADDGLHVVGHGPYSVVYDVRPSTPTGRVVAPLIVDVRPDEVDRPERGTPLRTRGLRFVAPDGPLSRTFPTTESVAEVVAELGLDEHAGAVLSALVPGIRLRTIPRGSSGGVTSRLGGLPDLPSVAVWPRGRRGSLTFLGQIRLDDLVGLPAAGDLPPRGLLSFFWDELTTDSTDGGTDGGTDGAASRVLFHRRVAGLAPQDPPADLAALSGPHDRRWRRFPERGLLPMPTLTLPEDFRLPDDDWRAATDVAATLGTGHRLLGEPYPAQAALAGSVPDDGRGDRGRWRLLLQLHGEEPFTAVHEQARAWGGTHAVFVMIRERDLAERAFDRAVLHAQEL
jgi:uncharacterized protein YwqG